MLGGIFEKLGGPLVEALAGGLRRDQCSGGVALVGHGVHGRTPTRKNKSRALSNLVSLRFFPRRRTMTPPLLAEQLDRGVGRHVALCGTNLT